MWLKYGVSSPSESGRFRLGPRAALRQEEQLACRFPALQIPMRLRRFRQGVRFLNVQVQLAGPHPLEQLAGSPLQVVRITDVVRERRPREKQRPFLAED